MCVCVPTLRLKHGCARVLLPCSPVRLIPIRTSEWPQVHDDLLPGTEVVVRVHKINDYPKYRCETACRFRAHAPTNKLGVVSLG